MQYSIWFYLLVVFGSVLIAGGTAWLIARKHHINRLRQELKRPFEELRYTPTSKLPPELAILSGLSVWDTAYLLSHVNPNVLKGMDWADGKDPTSFHEMILQAETRYSGFLGPEKTMNIQLAKLQGAVGEFEADTYHKAAGFDVVLPNTTTQRGWDRLYNQDPVQIKTVSSLRNVREHFTKYPEKPCLVNEELGDKLIDDPNINVVYWSEDINYEELPPYTAVIGKHTVEEVRENMGETIGALGATPFLDYFPWITTAFSIRREAPVLMQGKLDLLTFAEHVGGDVVTRVGGAYAGKEMGELIGETIAGKPGAMVGQAVGAIAGIAVGMKTGRWFKERYLRAARERYITALKEVGRCSTQAIEATQQDLVYKKADALTSAPKSNIFKRVFWPEANDIVYSELRNRYNSSIRKTKQLLKIVNELIRKGGESELVEAGRLVAFGEIQVYHPALNEPMKELGSAHDGLKKEMEKLGLLWK